MMSAFGSDSGHLLVTQLRRIADALEKIVEAMVGGPPDRHIHAGERECWPGCPGWRPDPPV